MFMAYLHQNYPPFCNDIENCANLMEYTSIADAIMRMEGDNVSMCWKGSAAHAYSLFVIFSSRGML